eukprot:TRINITY_DN8787_c0_g1_i2.p1 TRINITY_DN8787_c0_g1~~TRINITY_DN8787_c0_g1_i2.p1  ORF type:complete len:475 (+),score=139.79 TRINITY_DN8787_c0_g1_i2:61-1485(+)
MRAGGYGAYSPSGGGAYGGVVGLGSPSVYDRLYSNGVGATTTTTTDIYGRPTSPRDTTTPVKSPLVGERPVSPRGASRSPLDRPDLYGAYGAPATSTPPPKPAHELYGRSPLGGAAAGRAGSILSENPYSLGTTSYKSSLSAPGAAYRGIGTSGLTGHAAHRDRLSSLQSSTAVHPTLQHTASFNSGVYGYLGTPTGAEARGADRAHGFDAAAAANQSPNTPQRQGQRIRGTSFRDDYCGLSPRSRALRRAPSMLGQPGTMMVPPQAASDVGKYSIVLDLDETLIYARDGPLYARPGVEELFDLLQQKAEAIAWTAGLRAYAQAVLANIDKKSAIKHCIYRHHKWFTGQAGYQKDLSLLGRPLDKTLIIENTPDCIRGNRENGILVADYEGGELPDSTIPRMTEFLAGLIDSGLSVPRYLAQCPMLTRRNVPTDRGDYIECYWLDTSASHSTAGTRINRDLSAEQRLGAPRYGR